MLQPCHAGKTFAVGHTFFREQHDFPAADLFAEGSDARQKLNGTAPSDKEWGTCMKTCSRSQDTFTPVKTLSVSATSYTIKACFWKLLIVVCP
jgi:hypothetical protein